MQDSSRSHELRLRRATKESRRRNGTEMAGLIANCGCFFSPMLGGIGMLLFVPGIGTACSWQSGWLLFIAISIATHGTTPVGNRSVYRMPVISACGCAPGGRALSLQLQRLVTLRSVFMYGPVAD